MGEDHRPTPSFFIDKLLQKDPRKLNEEQSEESASSSNVSNTTEIINHVPGFGKRTDLEMLGDLEICSGKVPSTTTISSQEFRTLSHERLQGGAPIVLSNHLAYSSNSLCYGSSPEDMGVGMGGNIQIEVPSAETKYSCFGISDVDKDGREMIDTSCPGQSGHPGQDHQPITVSEEDKTGVDLNIGDDGKKRPRTAFSAEQVRSLEQEFQRSKYLSVSKRTEMSRQLGLTEQQIKIWFQNRRTKWKRKYTNNLEILAQQHYLRMGLLPAYPLHSPGGATKPPGQYGGLFGPNLTVRPAFPSPHQGAVRLYPPFNGPGLPRM